MAQTTDAQKVCPACGGALAFDHQDDVGTTWFKCSKCMQETNKPRTMPKTLAAKPSPSEAEIDGLIGEEIKDLTRAVTLDEVKGILESTIRHDERNKLITFLSMLLTYTEEDQINISFTAESSTGKSYIPLELAWYFPSSDIIEYSYVSPTAFFHEYGALLPDPTDKRELENEKQRRKIIVIDLHQKILVFIDQPHDMLLQRLRPLLSHDRKRLVAKITDRREKAGLRTKTVLIEGYPTVLFCTAKFSMEEQERTRLLLLSPDTTQEKIRDAILLKIEKESDRQAFQKYMDGDPRRNWLRKRVEAVANSGVKYIVVPEELRAKISSRFLNIEDSSVSRRLIPRHQRDITRLLALIKAHALLNLWNRQRVEDAIIIEQEDVLEGFRLYREISAANELGLPPEVYNIFVELKERIPESGATKKELRALYYQTFYRTIGQKRLDETLSLLESVGLLAEERDPANRSQKLFLPTPSGVCVGGMKSDGADQGDGRHTPRGVGETMVSAYRALREKFQSASAFSQKDATDVIRGTSECDESEAERIFRVLIDEGKVAMDPQGLWCFT